MNSPLILKAATWSHVLPVLAYASARTRTRPGLYLAAGSLIGLLSNLVGRWLAATIGNNQIVSYITSPAMAACWFAALAEWQVTGRERRRLRLAIIPFAVVWIVLVALVEDVRNFDLVTGPLYSLSLLGVAVWTLIRRAGSVEATLLHDTDWFWAALGIAVNGACTALSSPVGAILLARGRVDLFVFAWEVRATLVIASLILISWGIYRGPMLSKFSTIGTTEP